jgi:hypothetical protein
MQVLRDSSVGGKLANLPRKKSSDLARKDGRRCVEIKYQLLYSKPSSEQSELTNNCTNCSREANQISSDIRLDYST